ncbi:hypothetical protein G5B88_17585 [Herbaspirillum seropedicae]|uniref:Transmembrane protein n=1 Tax=Herbaspirillum seropedicae (strain SmR1) TaxID=757424 RepID=D8IPR1_HERSS|nr:hypothetical protein [Herbaspirillum seropedicae]ADJ64958.1 hypothetical protein Hsero_3479 [Herbaspirillum seropedicae SmR1]AON55804.1 hypothetical protein Hsc_3538 [Herbaspirillum seropedicae]MDR6395214.1 hypothetical protein [Herbaspirillum seropedicae]UMU22840.1 hypothetical protein G5B88_17585 [Herbaspirillum seropedicae]
MSTVGTGVLLVGLAVMVAAQVYVTLKTFTVSASKGVLCFVIPGYAFLIAKRHGFYGKFLLAYILGILGMVIGGGILS